MGPEHANTPAFQLPRGPGWRRLSGGLGCLLAATPILVMFAGFSVDDARIVSRVAESGARSGCFCFNPPDFSDAVTPLGYAHLVGGLVRLTGAAALFVQSALGLAAWAITVFVLGAAASWRERPWLAGLLAVNIPFAAWAGAGLETPLVALVLTGGALLVEGGRGRLGALALGCAAALRPELVIFGVASLVSLARAEPEWEGEAGGGQTLRHVRLGRLRRLGQRLLLLCLPIGLCAALRLHWFGTVVPLSLSAKEPAFGVGLVYAAFALLGTGAPLLVVLLDRGPWRLAIALHFVALALAGGDWMPLYRLAVPVIPLSLLLAARALAHRGCIRSASGAIGLATALVSAGLLAARFHERAPGVRAREEALIAEVRPHLTHLERVATVDVGWVGAAAPGQVVDLGGVTDVRVAALPGGHTSRTITPGFFSARDVTGWVFRAVVTGESPARSLDDVSAVYAVDERLRRRSDDLGFKLVRTFPRPGTSEVYVLARYVTPEGTR